MLVIQYEYWVPGKNYSLIVDLIYAFKANLSSQAIKISEHVGNSSKVVNNVGLIAFKDKDKGKIYVLNILKSVMELDGLNLYLASGSREIILTPSLAPSNLEAGLVSNPYEVVIRENLHQVYFQAQTNDQLIFEHAQKGSAFPFRGRIWMFSEEVSTDIEDLQRIRNKASTDVSNASTDNIHQRMSASTDKDFN
ncbi:hypothetical protein AgCh_030476 [Apium graveolens]